MTWRHNNFEAFWIIEHHDRSTYIFIQRLVYNMLSTLERPTAKSRNDPIPVAIGGGGNGGSVVYVNIWCII